jgi:leader peptidase (prepilin peptidase)/N-methyltransferase
MTFIPPPDWILSARGTELIIVTLAFGLGATLGSFLNVVVHRAPRGESVVGGRSYCPSCGSPVRARDNLPILGWLLLRGRCRDCRHPIPAHYPLVEAACGGLLAAVAVAELSSGGRAGPAAIDRILMRGDAGPVFAWFCRSALLLVLVVWAEFARRGRTVSWRAVGMAVAGVAAAGVLVPSLAPPGILSLCGCGSSGGGWSQPLAAAVVGGVAGWVAGIAAGPAAGRSCMLVGAAFGWQGVAVALTLLSAAWALGRCIPGTAGNGAVAASADRRGWDLVAVAVVLSVASPHVCDVCQAVGRTLRDVAG